MEHPLNLKGVPILLATELVILLMILGAALVANALLLYLLFAEKKNAREREIELLRETDLQFSSQQRLLLETQSIANLGSWHWDIREDKVNWSPQLFKIFEVDPANFSSSYGSYLERLRPEYRELLKSVVERAQKTGEPYQVEHAFTHSDGTDHYIQSRGVAVRNYHGEIVKLMGTCQDITKEKLNEEILKNSHEDLEQRVRERTHQLWEALERERMAKEAKMTFLANMSHEIRTPMNAILGFSNLLLEQPLNAEQLAMLARIKTNGDHLLRLIDDILDLSKFEAGRIPVEKHDLNLPHLIQEVVNSVSGLAEKKKIRTSIVYDSALPEKIKTDPLRLRQILTNLLSNSIKFSEQGEITVRVSQFDKPFARQTSVLTIEVHDTGIGISTEDQRQLFQPFTQADNSGTRRFGGTGLGLALSRHIARALDGELILVHSNPGQGSCFRLTIELAEVPAPKRATLLLGAAGDLDVLPTLGTADFTGPQTKRSEGTDIVEKKHLALPPCRILLAEDSPDNEDLIRMYLKFEGVVIDSATNGEEAISLALQKHYDLILMDVQMPVLDGLEATRRLRARGYVQPILALTAHAMQEDHDRSLKAGCSGHLTKPIQKAELVNSILRELNSNGHETFYDARDFEL